MLVALGLKSIHESVYQAMLKHDTWGVAELAAHLAFTEDEVRAALDALFELRLIRESFDAPGRLRAVDAGTALRALLDRQHEELLRRQRQAADRHAAIARMIAQAAAHAWDHGAALPAGGAAPGGTEQLLGMDAVQQRLEQLAEEAAEEILTFMPGGAQSAAALDAARRNDARVLARGVSMRTVGLDSLRQDPPTLAHARWLTGRGAAFRTVAALPPRMIVADRRAALVPLDPADTRKGVLYVTCPGVIASLTALFLQVWEHATSLGADAPAPRPGLSDTERDLLHLIGQGYTDEAAATRLHISPRTARRMMAAIMERLGARSRFEAGLKAAREGWL
ncbi:helix-turn-helix transcriptional regulator [Streptomyces sp. MST-110588]|uniref:helix-turn-helix transcriptional regulator n=1 Tax=Streptomyces sp. MST-110588 TaxID=2833628 RepID=UPI001F5E273D|nr:helix-turn-helix transcriptional regulator [Streptomyces sp. MST-110588]UNO41649.1 helix-turn-helix transcriptional regulator [Streptomyces sp. MST-110588]